jgi:tetratricopeptide (TPR) repeat protein
MPSLPFSGQVVAAVVRAFGLSTDALAAEVGLSGRHVRAYLAGARLGADARQRILNAVALRAAESEAIRGCVREAARADAGRLLASLLIAWADQWDCIVSHWRVYTIDEPSSLAAARAAFRLVTIDAVVRSAGLAMLLEAEVPPSVPRWAQWALEEDGSPKLLQALKKQATLSIADLADSIGDEELTDSAIRKHLDGSTIPTDEHVDMLADALAAGIRDASARALTRELRLHYSLHRLARMLAEQIGWGLVQEAARFFAAAVHRVDVSTRGLDGDRGALSMIAFGSWHPAGHAFRPLLRELAPDTRWREAILGAWQDWSGFLMYEARRAERLGDVHFDGFVRPEAAVEWSLLGYLALALRRDECAAPYFRRAIELDEKNAEYHLDLASVLPNEQPDAVSMRIACEEALHHVRRALQLRPRWIDAQLEEALVLEDLEGEDAAERYLRGVMSERGGGDLSLVRYHVAVVAHRSGRLRAALGWLRPLVCERSTHAAAFQLAAYCHLGLGNQREAKRCAGRAEALGVTVVLPAPTPGDSPASR